MEEPVFFTLLQKYLRGEASDSEQRLVEEYYARLDRPGNKTLSDDQEGRLKELMLENINKSVDEHVLAVSESKRPKVVRWISYVAAASLIAILGIKLIFNPAGEVRQKKAAVAKVPAKQDDVEPGGNKAILTLADGSKVVLDDAQIGHIAKQAGISITKSADGKLVYTVPASYQNEPATTSLYNTIETPKGGQYQVNLPDGTRVWLNAASSIKFPTAFKGEERFVELTGEAYFEVTPNKLKPFKIRTQEQTVEVLGTQFNINSYINESSIKTTLVEGSVKVSNSGSAGVSYLKPGQQSVARNGSIRVQTVNTDQITAWRTGRFIFNDMELESIMRQLERWYDVEVDYSTIPKTSYNAHLSMDLKLSKVLEVLEVSGSIKFKIDGRTIKILRN